MTSSVSLTYDEVMVTAIGDFDAAEVLRQVRRDAVARAAEGHLAEILSSPDESPASRVYVVKLLDAHPALGKVKGRRLLATLGLSEFVRIRDLSSRDKTDIAAACGENP